MLNLMPTMSAEACLGSRVQGFVIGLETIDAKLEADTSHSSDYISKIHS
jgi:hypothetical protein